MQRNQPTIILVLGIVLGLVFVVAWAVTREPLALGGAVLLFIVALMGDRLKKAPGGWEFYRGRIATAVRAEAPPPPITGTGAFEQAPAEVHGTGTVLERTAEDTISRVDEAAAQVVRLPTIDARAEAFQPTIVTSTAQALIAASDALDTATSPEELAGRLVEYVGLYNLPGLRELSPERVLREQALFGAILELQTLRARGNQPPDARRSAVVLERVARFWSRPELLSDEAVEDTTEQVRALIAEMSS
jgi:hypothetical protein